MIQKGLVNKGERSGGEGRKHKRNAGQSSIRVAISRSDGFTTIHSPLLISIGKLLAMKDHHEWTDGWMSG